VDRNHPTYADDPTLERDAAQNEGTPGWEPVVGTTYEPQDERMAIPERDVEHDTSATHDETTNGYDKDATGYEGR